MSKIFELLVSLGVFNDSLMNDAVYKFKRYEDASLSYTGIDRHEGENRGGWDTVISDADYNSMFALQQASMEVPIPSADDLPEKPFLDFAEAVRDIDQPKKEKQYSQKVAERSAVYGRHFGKATLYSTSAKTGRTCTTQAGGLVPCCGWRSASA